MRISDWSSDVCSSDLDAIADVRWIKENGLRGGVLLPNVPPDVKYVKPLYDPCYDPLWEVCQELEIPVNVHSGSGNPDYGAYPVSMLLYINRSEENTSELQSLMRISYAVFCLKNKNNRMH